MLMIRLIRIGKKNYPSFRLVLTEKRTPPRGGKFIEILGSYNSRKKIIDLKKERIEYWLSQGAKPSDTAHNILVSQGIIKGEKIKKKLKIKKKEAKEKTEEKKEQKTEPVKEEGKPEEDKKEEEKPVEEKKEEAEEEKKE